MAVSDTERFHRPGAIRVATAVDCRHRGLTGRVSAGVFWPRHGLVGHVNVQNSRQNGHTTPLAWPKGPPRGQRDRRVAKGTAAWPKGPPRGQRDRRVAKGTAAWPKGPPRRQAG